VKILIKVSKSNSSGRRHAGIGLDRRHQA